MPDPRLHPVPDGLPERLAGAASVHLWRRYLLDAGMPLAVDEPVEAPGDWVRGWTGLLDEVDAWRLVEAERDALDVSSALVVGTVPRAVWVGMLVVSTILVNFLGFLWGAAAALAGFTGLSVLGLSIYAWNERIRRLRLAAARRAHAGYRAQVGRLARALLTGPLDVIVGDVRYLIVAGASPPEDPPSPPATR